MVRVSEMNGTTVLQLKGTISKTQRAKTRWELSLTWNYHQLALSTYYLRLYSVRKDIIPAQLPLANNPRCHPPLGSTHECKYQSYVEWRGLCLSVTGEI